MKESDIRKALKERVESYGGEIRAVSWLGRRHAPDVLVLLPRSGYNCFVETKRPGGSASAAQDREHERLRAAGCSVTVITTPKELDDFLWPLK